MTQKPPSRQPSASKRTTQAKPSSSRASSGRAAATNLPDLSKIKLPKGGGCISAGQDLGGGLGSSLDQLAPVQLADPLQ